MKRISKDEYYLNIASVVLQRSTCLKRRYGCVIVNNDEIVATGYNGSPRGEANCCDIYEECPRKNIPHNSGNYQGCPAIHAEQNAFLSASRSQCIGATLYLSGEEFHEGKWIPIEATPCPMCKNHIKNMGIKKVIGSKGGKCDC